MDPLLLDNVGIGSPHVQNLFVAALGGVACGLGFTTQGSPTLAGWPAGWARAWAWKH